MPWSVAFACAGLASLLATSSIVTAAGTPVQAASVPFYRRHVKRTFERESWLAAERARLTNKYLGERDGDPEGRLRERQIVSATFTGLPSSATSSASIRPSSTSAAGGALNGTLFRGVSDGRGGVVGLQRTLNFQADLEYYAPIRIGTPPQELNLILDTGSSDTWLASPFCTSAAGCPANVQSFSPANSTSSKNLTTPFTIRYGSGSATGSLFTDNVTLAGYSMATQTFALVDSISSDLLSQNISGLMGLGFQTLASSGVTPMWQALVSNSSYDLAFPGFSFALTRFINVSGAAAGIEPGGLFTLGTLNASLFTGSINFVPVPQNLESYWLVRMDALRVNATSIDLSGEATMNVAIDTGTTLIGGPPSQVQALYAGVPGSTPATGSYEGYYTYPCNSTVNLTFTFGGVDYPMSSQDFNLGAFGPNSTCLGAVFELDLSGASRSLISWVIGDSFLKNVFTAYRYSPPAVGFARLSPLFNSTGNATVVVNGTLFNNATLNTTEASVSPSLTTTYSPSAVDQTAPAASSSTIPRPTSGEAAVRWPWPALLMAAALGVTGGPILLLA